MHGEISTIDQIESPPFISRFPNFGLRGRKESKEGAFFMESFACCERSTWAMEMRSVAWGFLREAASIPCGRLGAACFTYLLELFYFREGRISLAGWFIPSRISSHQIVVRSVAEWGHLLELHSYGGVFRIDITVGSWSEFFGSGSLHEGRTILGSICWCRACLSTQLEFLLYQFLPYIVFTITLLLLFFIYTFRFKTGFPQEGFVQSHVDQKYLCLQMHVLVLRSAHFQ